MPSALVQLVIIYLPGLIGDKIRYRYWHHRLKFLGRNVKIEAGVHFQNPAYISIDDNCWIDKAVIIMGGPDKSKREKKYINNEKFKFKPGEVVIGKNVHIATNVIISGIGGISIGNNSGIASGSKIYSFSHHYRSFQSPVGKEVFYSPMVPSEKQVMIEGPITMGENVGMGFNTIILPGTIIGDRSFIVVGSVVYGSFPPNSFVSGNPAKRIKARFLD
ncbi:MAG: hypothetical protein R2828_04240 [Saprospiraceae bacterium]